MDLSVKAILFFCIRQYTTTLSILFFNNGWQLLEGSKSHTLVALFGLVFYSKDPGKDGGHWWRIFTPKLFTKESSADKGVRKNLAKARESFQSPIFLVSRICLEKKEHYTGGSSGMNVSIVSVCQLPYQGRPTHLCNGCSALPIFWKFTL